MASISHHGRLFRTVDQPNGTSRFQRFLSRLKALDMMVFCPVLLALLDRPGLNEEDRDAFVTALESYLVRRMVCGEQTRGYGALALEILNVIATVAEPEPTAPTLSQFLVARGGTLRWPKDEQFRQHWCSRQFYGYFRRNRVLMILQALEEHYQDPGAWGEPIIAFDYDALSIEHIMPQNWRARWPQNQVDPLNRDRVLHGIGNLTLVSAPLNAALSDRPWQSPEGKPTKPQALAPHTILQLNAHLLQRWPDQWDEQTIQERALALFAAARVVWPAGNAAPVVV